jgi:viroplasmin and RNaseH domain-containing protein
MSEEFEVKGLHEEVLEANEESNGFNGRLAVMTAVMATVGAILSYEASVTLGEAIIFKNEASIQKTSASDQWNFYQAKGNKQNLAELTVKLTTGKDHDESVNEVKRFNAEKSDIKKKAEGFEMLSHQADEKSEHSMHLHHRWATGTTALQIAISLAAIALLTRRRWLQYASISCAVVGIGFGICAWFGV